MTSSRRSGWPPWRRTSTSSPTISTPASALDGVTVYGPPAGTARAALAAFNVAGVHANDLSAFVDQDGIAIRAGHHCTQPLHAALGVSATARASLYVYSTREDVDALVESIVATQRLFAGLGQ